MPTTRLVSLGALLSLLSVTLTAQPSGLLPDPKGSDFGTSNLTHVRVSAFDFVPVDSANAGDWKKGDGFTRYPTDNLSDWAAPVHLPGGALLKRIELDYCDTSTID